jgi:hypothetical protein
MIALTTAIWGMLSGPMAEMGVRDVVIKLFKMDMVQAEREGRIIILTILLPWQLLRLRRI